MKKSFLYLALGVAAMAHYGNTYGMNEKELRLHRENELLRENRELRIRVTELEQAQDKQSAQDRREKLEAEFLKCLSGNAESLRKDNIPYRCRDLASALAAIGGRSAVENAHSTALYISSIRS